VLFTRKPQARLLLHVLFWTLYVGFFTAVLRPFMPWIEALGKVSAVGATYALFVYTNLRWAIPVLLWRGRYLAYAGAVTGLTLACAASVWQVMIGLDRFGSPMMSEGVTLLPAVFNAAFMVFVTTSAKLLLHSLEQQETNRQLENQQLQTEINFLKSQVNPHFLFNTLNNLYALTLTKNDRAPEIVLKLSAILRYMLYECNERFVFLNKEIEYLRNYIELEELRQAGRGEILLKVEGATDRKRIAPLLFTPLLENAIKHGLNKTAGKAWVRIDLVVRGDDLRFTITNSKPPGASRDAPAPLREVVPQAGGAAAVAEPRPAPPRSAAEPDDGSPKRRDGGIGLLNVKRRLDLLYPQRHGFRISEGAETYTVHLKLRLDA
jgi:two-component system LytT family sensor kinase